MGGVGGFTNKIGRTQNCLVLVHNIRRKEEGDNTEEEKYGNRDSNLKVTVGNPVSSVRNDPPPRLLPPTLDSTIIACGQDENQHHTVR